MGTAGEEFELSPLERRLLAQLAQGVPSKMLAAQLRTSESSLHQHVKSLCRKLRVTGRQDAIKWARLNRPMLINLE
jgi:DNA-binding CsgD family transcriptional regulator